MNIPRSALDPFGFTGMPTVTQETIGWAKANRELEEAISFRFEEDAKGSFYAPYVPCYTTKVMLQTLPPKKRETVLAVLSKVRRQMNEDS